MAVTEAQAEKAKRAALKALRASWWMWKRANMSELSHIDYCLAACPERCGYCDGCASEAWRRGKQEDLATEAAFIKQCQPIIRRRRSVQNVN